MAMKMYSTFSKSPRLKPYRQMQFSVLYRTLVVEVGMSYPSAEMESAYFTTSAVFNSIKFDFKVLLLLDCLPYQWFIWQHILIMFQLSKITTPYFMSTMKIAQALRFEFRAFSEIRFQFRRKRLVSFVSPNPFAKGAGSIFNWFELRIFLHLDRLPQQD